MRLFSKDGVYIWVDSDWDVISGRLVTLGDWEPPQAELICGLGRPDWTFVDIGAHIGYFSLMAAPHYGQVVAFEPNEYACDLHRRSAAINGFTNVRIEQCEFDETLRADVLKIDIDGGEREVFERHPELLEAHAIFFEYVPAVADGFEPIAFLQDAGFTVLHEHGQPLTERIPHGFWGANFIAVKDVEVPCLSDEPAVWAEAITVIGRHPYECECEMCAVLV